MRQHACVTMSPGALEDEKLLLAWSTHNDAHYVAEFGLPPETPDPMTGQPRPTRAVDDPMYAQRWKFIMGLAPDPAAMAAGAPAGPDGAPEMPPNGPAAVAPPTNPQNGQQFSNQHRSGQHNQHRSI